MIEVIAARPFHCGQMSRRLRIEHRAALAPTGMDSHIELRQRFDASCYRRSILIEGQLGGMWGVTGSVISPFGFLWLVLTDAATHHPAAILRLAKRELDTIMQTKSELVTTVLAGDKTALRFAIFLGFHVSHEGRGRRAHSRFARRDLANYLDSTPDHRIPVGGAYVITLGYHHEHEQEEAA